MKSYTIKGNYNDRKWYVVDADGKILGRLCSRIATILRGKHKPVFTPNRDVGDFVIVINAGKVAVTGHKEDKKIYYKHTGYMGHLHSATLRQIRAKRPEFIIRNAVWKMLPKNNLGRKMIKKLKVYAGSKHPHSAQQPEPLTL